MKLFLVLAMIVSAERPDAEPSLVFAQRGNVLTVSREGGDSKLETFHSWSIELLPYIDMDTVKHFLTSNRLAVLRKAPFDKLDDRRVRDLASSLEYTRRSRKDCGPFVGKIKISVRPWEDRKSVCAYYQLLKESLIRESATDGSKMVSFGTLSLIALCVAIYLSMHL